MRQAIVIATTFFLGLGAMQATFGGDRVYRCGNEYTNTPTSTQRASCKPVTNANVTVMEIPAAKSVQRKIESGNNQAKQRNKITGTDQNSKHVDAKRILDVELQREQQKLDDIKKEYNSGEPEKIGPEHKNYQKYLDRAAQLKADMERTQSNIDALKRELVHREKEAR